jgi:hypothetical protein
MTNNNNKDEAGPDKSSFDFSRMFGNRRHPFDALGEKVISVVKRADRWTIEHPYQAAAAGAVVAAATAVPLAKVAALSKGATIAFVAGSAAWGAGKAFAYPMVRAHGVVVLQKAGEHAGRAYANAKEAAGAARRRAEQAASGVADFAEDWRTPRADGSVVL